MTILVPSVTKCPHCGQLHKDVGVMSYSVFSGVEYTDGYSIDGAPAMEPLAQCVSCYSAFLRNAQQIMEFDEIDEELKKFFKSPAASRDDDMDRLPDVEIVQSADIYNEFLKNEKTDPETEYVLRTHLLWMLNNPKRIYLQNNKLSSAKPLNARAREMMSVLKRKVPHDDVLSNMERLLEIIETEDLYVSPMRKADLLRSLGRFDEAGSLLDALSENDIEFQSIENMARLQKKLIKRKDKGVYGISF